MVATWSCAVVTNSLHGTTVWKPTMPPSGVSATWMNARAGSASM